jgi:hypothetical protein
MSNFSKNNRGYSIVGFVVTIAVLAGLLFVGYSLVSSHKLSDAINKKSPSKSATTTPIKVAAAPNPCASNSLSQLVLVSTSARHLWACDYTTEAYNSPVITGMDFLAADITPTGTYHIYAKETDTHLIGHDSTGSWNDYVYYWEPFLTNQFGEYGLHDATWRSSTDFGSISPGSNEASHGCVEMPLATAAWIYNWSQIGTTVTIEA